MGARNERLLLWDLQEEHLDEATFLWQHRERALDAPDRTPEDVAELEERLLAHLDALALGGEPVARRLLRPAFEAEEDERLSAALFALVTGAPEALAGVLERARNAEPGPLAAIGRALELLDHPGLPAGLMPFVWEDEPALIHLALEVLAFQGVDPGPLPPSLLLHEVPHVAAAALRAGAACPGAVERQWVQHALSSPSPAIRDAAIRLGLLGGLGEAWEACRAAVRARAPALRLPLFLLAIGGDEGERHDLQALLAAPALRPDVLWALGFSGRVESAEACLALMEDQDKDERLVALAGEAFSSITGLCIEGPYALPRSDEGEEEPIPLEQEDLDADLVPRPEDALPCPCVQRVAEWWWASKAGFERGRRYLNGRPFGPEVLLDALSSAPMRRRHALALELELRTRGAQRLQTRGLMAAQVPALRQARAAIASSPRRSFAAELHT